MNNALASIPEPTRPEKKRSWAFNLLNALLLFLILVTGAFFRYIGIQWGEFQYLHPDERFLVWVGTDIQPIGTPQEALGTPPDSMNNPWRVSPDFSYPDCQAWGGYFDASCSPLNPNNRGHPFYVYGTLPMFVTRYLVQWIYGHSGFNEMTIVGRMLSALVDLGCVVLVYAIASRLFNRKIGLLAAAFSAFTVLDIQQSHFFTMDTFASFFTLLAVYLAVRVSLVGRDTKPVPPEPDAAVDPPADQSAEAVTSQMIRTNFGELVRSPFFALSIAFGAALGLAVASKLNAAPVAFVLPVAFGVVVWRKPAHERPRWLMNAAIYLAMAAFVSLLVFRIFQPYAFYGPSFFGIRPNPQWVSNIKEQRNQAAGDIDFPPALQWARRPVWFSAQNMVVWGLGIPLGILAFTGFLWAGWRMLKGDWSRHVVLWLWGAFYFTWQSLQFNPTMRYQMPAYPILVIYAAWTVWELWNFQKRKRDGFVSEAPDHHPPVSGWSRLAGLLAGGFVLLSTLAWALAFSLIYSRPITRVDASDWIYQNIPGPVNLHIQTADGTYNQPLSIPYGSTIQHDYPYQMAFTSNATGSLNEVYLAHVADVRSIRPVALNVSLLASPDGSVVLVSTEMSVASTAEAAGQAGNRGIKFESPVTVVAGKTIYLALSLVEGEQVVDACGNVEVMLQAATEPITQTVATGDGCLLGPDTTYILPITPMETGLLEAVTLARLVDQTPVAREQTLKLTIGPTGGDQVVATASLTADLAPGVSKRGSGYTMMLDHPVSLELGKNYSLSLSLESDGGVVVVQGSAIANEGDWDDGLPLRVDGYDPFGGIYTPGLNFNMYTDDNSEKLDRFTYIYEQTEYLLISSNRQWGTLPRLPERFPMTTLHYRHLLGCPDDRTVEWCYSVAEPGMFHGDLGFELIKIFQSDPALGSLSINDQFAEEAFTVYDHPKVLVFQKTGEYDAAQASRILNQANFTEIVRITPKRAEYHPANLMMYFIQQDGQVEGGTWSELFNPESWQNRFQPLGVVLWYVSVGLLGLLVYPLLRIALPGLPDHGYPLARTAGMLILAYLTWLAGSATIPFNRLTISLVLLLMAAGGIYLAYRQRDELRREWASNRRYFLIVEGLMLGLFLLFLFIRLGNPDLWHPWKGGEKPMDFSYFNAVLKSTTFPPYDPWYAGGFMNYYYWGFIFVGVLVKWLGIVPSFAYNLILPTLFAMVGMGAFSIGYNLSHPRSQSDVVLATSPPPEEEQSPPPPAVRPYLVGLASVLGMAILGNLGTLRMIAKGWEQLGIPGGLTESTGLLTRVGGLFKGLYMVLFQGASMPYSLGDWYWIPSRAIPAPGDVEPITEFPLFTFLYGDLHAHMIALVIVMLALTWAVAVVLGKARWRSLGAGVLGILLGGLAIGALYPTNLSDIYTYLPIGMLAFGYAIYRYADISHWSRLPRLSSTFKRLVLAGAGALLLAILSYGLYLPYRLWYAQGYSTVIPWFGTHTPLASYLTHWGLFLFVILSWMIWETREWMASTPLSELRKLEKYSSPIILVLVLLLLACLLLSIRVPEVETISLLGKLPIGRGAALVWFILPVAAWAGVLLLRPGMPDAKRLVLFWVGTGLLITLMVEVVVVRGDIGRMNTVFKFYLHTWSLFALSAAAALGWLLDSIRRWRPGWRVSWWMVFWFLVLSATLFTLYGSMAKIKDRWVPGAPHSLDGMTFMPFSTYYESYPGASEAIPVEQRGLSMDLSQDYRLIRWMQENIQGSPVIVEANSRSLYRWYSRATIYTGLPGVVGWEWHEQQQRSVNPSEWVTKRVMDIEQFYLTVDTDLTRQFLNLYGVKYIVLGQLERLTYPGPGLDKFDAFNGILWNEVYRDGDTILYEVIR